MAFATKKFCSSERAEEDEQDAGACAPDYSADGIYNRTRTVAMRAIALEVERELLEAEKITENAVRHAQFNKSAEDHSQVVAAVRSALATERRLRSEYRHLRRIDTRVPDLTS